MRITALGHGRHFWRLVMGLSLTAFTVPGFAGGEPADRAPSLEVERVADVAGQSPYLGLDCNVFTADWMESGGREGEPMIAVNPRDPDNRIAVWMDRTRASINTAHTSDGGRHWARSHPQHVDECTGNFDQEWEATGDPWVTFGPDGTAYFSFLSWAHFETPPLSSYVSVVHTATSVDGGKTWSYPVGVGHQDWTSDKDMIVADPRTAGTVYAGWRNAGFGLPVGSKGDNLLLFSKTTDYGHSWSPQTVVDTQAGPFSFFGNPQLVVLNDGALVYTSSVNTSSGDVELVSYRSTDGGTSWSQAAAIATLSSGGAPPVCGHSVNGGYGQTTSVGQLVAHIEVDPATAALGRGEIILYWSEDGGVTWQNKPVINSPNLIIQASATVDRHHRLAILWDETDLSQTDCGAQPIPIVPSVTKLAVSRDREDWHTITVGAESFNLASALVPPSYNLGDYHSLASTPRGYATVTVQGVPLRKDAPRIDGNTGVMVGDVEVENGGDE
jgi:hypothetical protein